MNILFFHIADIQLHINSSLWSRYNQDIKATVIFKKLTQPLYNELNL